MLMLRVARTSWLIVLLTLLLTACNRAPTQKKSESETLSPPKTLDRVLGLTYEAKVDGDINIEFRRNLGVRVLTTTGADPKFLSIYLLSVGPSEPVPVDGGAYFRVAFDLVKYTGSGSYRIRAGSPADLVGQPQPSQSGDQPPDLDQSNVLVQFWPDGDPHRTFPQTFNRTLDPCPLEVSKGGVKGSLRCDRMTDDNGHEISVLMEWG